jgi:hypothetical protein
MFELHMVVAGIVMFNIMELIMEIVPNYPTEGRRNPAKIQRSWQNPSKIGHENEEGRARGYSSSIWAALHGELHGRAGGLMGPGERSSALGGGGARTRVGGGGGLARTAVQRAAAAAGGAAVRRGARRWTVRWNPREAHAGLEEDERRRWKKKYY